MGHRDGLAQPSVAERRFRARQGHPAYFDSTPSAAFSMYGSHWPRPRTMSMEAWPPPSDRTVQLRVQRLGPGSFTGCSSGATVDGLWWPLSESALLDTTAGAPASTKRRCENASWIRAIAGGAIGADSGWDDDDG